MDELRQLNSEQRKAVETVDGRVLVLAGAGSGKTRVLTMRMAYLIKYLHVSPKNILGLTFTNKAAAEMRHRIGGFVDFHIAKQISLCTFHSFCMQLLREEIHYLGYTKNFTLYDDKDVQRLIILIVRDILGHEGELPSLAVTISAINHAKNKGLRPEELVGTGSLWHDRFTQEVYQRLQSSMRAYNAVDFDSLLWLAVELFERFPQVLDSYQERHKYIMIDEYQDTNPVQYRLASLLASKYNNLCVVGDDDQSIYGWRGAEVKNILSFGGATVIKLEQNYRSTNTILQAANSVISKNTERHAKALWSEKGVGDKIEVFHAPNEWDEAEAVVNRIAKLREKAGLHWRDIAILYRSNALSRQMELALMKYTWKSGDHWVQGIPYQIFGGLEFYERREVKDLCAYLRVIVNPLDQEALLRIINQPRRGIGDVALDALTSYNRRKNIPLWKLLEEVAEGRVLAEGLEKFVHSKALTGIRQFVDTIKAAEGKFESDSLSNGIQWLIDTIDYQKVIKEEVKSEQMRDFKWENVQEFISAVSEFEQGEEPATRGRQLLLNFIGSIPLESSPALFANRRGGEEDKVTLMTFHSAKGLEFPASFLVGVEDHIIPHEKSLADTGIEEERRLMYVAITRAKKYLTISMAQQRRRMGKECASRPSRFLFDIPKELLRTTDWRVVS